MKPSVTVSESTKKKSIPPTADQQSLPLALKGPDWLSSMKYDFSCFSQKAIKFCKTAGLHTSRILLWKAIWNLGELFIARATLE